jgi:glucose 1-dehydrogenase/3-oxoacyl-[acyl-carrier protein] reductase
MENIARFAKEAIEYLGHVDILINNAGMLCRETLLELSPDKMQHVFQVNTIAPLYLTQLCSLNMIENNILGSIINISSISGSMTMPKGIGYGASKAALNKWTKHAALNLAPHRIRVNVVAPGVVEAGMNEDTAITNPKLWEYYVNNIPLQKTGEPSDIAHMVLFLASEKASWITGKVFEVDGGHSI